MVLKRMSASFQYIPLTAYSTTKFVSVTLPLFTTMPYQFPAAGMTAALVKTTGL